MTVTTHDSVVPRNENGLYFFVWIWLVVLLVAGLSIFGLPIPREVAVGLIFGVAAVKAGLVLRNYMHLKHEHYLIYLIILVPVLFFLGLALALIPDIVLRHGM